MYRYRSQFVPNFGWPSITKLSTALSPGFSWECHDLAVRTRVWLTAVAKQRWIAIRATSQFLRGASWREDRCPSRKWKLWPTLTSRRHRSFFLGISTHASMPISFWDQRITVSFSFFLVESKSPYCGITPFGPLLLLKQTVSTLCQLQPATAVGQKALALAKRPYSADAI